MGGSVYGKHTARCASASSPKEPTNDLMVGRLTVLTRFPFCFLRQKKLDRIPQSLNRRGCYSACCHQRKTFLLQI